MSYSKWLHALYGMLIGMDWTCPVNRCVLLFKVVNICSKPLNTKGLFLDIKLRKCSHHSNYKARIYTNKYTISPSWWYRFYWDLQTFQAISSYFLPFPAMSSLFKTFPATLAPSSHFHPFLAITVISRHFQPCQAIPAISAIFWPFPANPAKSTLFQPLPAISS